MFGQLLIDPTDLELTRALQVELRAANPELPAETAGTGLVLPPEIREDLPGVRKVAEGWQIWPLSRRFAYGRVGLAWWTDPAGRRHVRLGGAHARTPAAERFFAPAPDIPPVARVHPERWYLRTIARESRPLVVCDCGVSGPPADLAWMGRCCGPCHDRYFDLGFDPLNTPGRLAPTHLEVNHPIHQLTLTNDGRWAATASRGNPIRLWDTQTGTEFAFPREDTHRVDLMRFSPDGTRLAGVCAHRLLIWNVPAGEVIAEWSEDLRAITCGFADDRCLVTGSMTGLQFWSLDTLRPHVRRDDRLTLREMAISPGGFPIVVHAGGHELTVIRSMQSEPETIATPSVYPSGLAFSHEGRYLATRESQQAAIRILDLPSKRWGTRIASLATDFRAFAFAPNNHRLLVTAGSDGRIRVWDAVTGLERVTFQWHLGPVLTMAFSMDGRLLATGGEDGIVKLWPWRKLLGA